MPNGARHGLGVAIGLIATPLVLAGLFFGANRLSLLARSFILRGPEADQWVAAAVLVAVAVVLGLLTGSRVSPVASLIAGLVLTPVGVLWVAAPRWTAVHTLNKLPDSLDRGYSIVAPYGLLLVIGVTLLVASLAPSRWSSRSAAAAPARHRAPGPYGPPPAPQGPPPARMDAPQAPPYGQQPSGQPSGQGQPAGQPAPWGAPPQQPSYRQEAAPPPDDEGRQPSSGGSEPDESAGEWTRIYGGGGDHKRGGGRPPG